MWCHSRSILLASRFTIQGLLQLEEIFSCCQSCKEHTGGLPDSCQNLGTTLRSLGVCSGGAPSLGSEQRLYKTVHGSQTETLQRPYSCTRLRKELTLEYRSGIKPPDLWTSYFMPFSVWLSLGVCCDSIRMPPSKDLSLNCEQSRTCSLMAELVLAWASNSEEVKLLIQWHRDNPSLIPSGFAFSFSKPPKCSVCRQRCFSPVLLENSQNLACETVVFIVI